MDRWVHIAHIYTGTNLEVYVDGIQRYDNVQSMYTAGKSHWNGAYLRVWYVPYLDQYSSYI